MMGDNGHLTPGPEGVPPSASQPFSAPQPRDTSDNPVAVQRLTMPLRWVVSVVIAVGGGVLATGSTIWALQAHTGDHASHLSPEVSAAGGVVTKRDLRRVLRAMRIQCAAGPGGSMACTVEIPTEAD
jgi:hypothetical protein